MLGLASFLMSREQREMERRFYEKDKERRLKLCVPWDPLIKWDPELNIKADTYQVRNLFPDVEPTPSPLVSVSITDEKRCAYSPTKRFVYVVKQLPAGQRLTTYYSNKRGSVVFDGPVLIPALHERCLWDNAGWNPDPWMSFAPMEFLTLRGGIRKAKGHTVIAGLGLGHQLIEVSLKKTVKQITLVEHSQELVDWLMPRIKPFLGPATLTVIVDDAKKVVPELPADVALIDIFTGYGGNTFASCPNIKTVWCWGSQYVG